MIRDSRQSRCSVNPEEAGVSLKVTIEIDRLTEKLRAEGETIIINLLAVPAAFPGISRCIAREGKQDEPGSAGGLQPRAPS